jgi:hypothetical protein
LEGFQNTLKKMPELVGIEMSPLRKELGDEIIALTEGYRADFDRIYGEYGAWLDAKLAGGGIPAGEAKKGLGRPKEVARAMEAGGGKGEAKGFEELTALYKRVASAAAKSPEQATAENTEKAAAEGKRAADGIDRLVGIAEEARRVPGPAYAVVAPGA